jgi:hypothetical protein
MMTALAIKSAENQARKGFEQDAERKAKMGG